jgi:integrase
LLNGVNSLIKIKGLCGTTWVKGPGQMVLQMARPFTRPNSRYPVARKVVPAPLRAILGRTEFRRALRGETPAEIRRLNAEAQADFEAQIAVAQAKLDGTVRTLTDKEIEAVCGEWYRTALAEHGDSPGDDERWSNWGDQLLDEFHEDEDGRTFVPRPKSLTEADELLTSQGIAADAATVAKLANRLHTTKLRFCTAMERRQGGDYFPDPNLPKFPSLTPSPQAAPSLTFEVLVAAWAAETKPPLKTREKWEAAFRSLAGVIGHDGAHRVTVNDVRQWKEHRQAQGRSNKTIADGIAVYRATWNWGARNGLLPKENPFANMAPRTPKRGPAARDGYDDKQAAKLLTAAREETGWKRWLPWVLAYTGARIEEVAEARTRDVRQESGVWMLDIVPTAERSLKTSQSQRMVPLHPALVHEGFLAYVEALPSGPLFPDIAPGRYGSRGSVATKAHSRWVRAKGIADPRIAPAHSWRHRMVDALRRARVPPEAADALTGHDNPRNAGAGYGKGFRGMPDELAKELRKVPAILPLPGGDAVQDSKRPRGRRRGGGDAVSTGHAITVGS